MRERPILFTGSMVRGLLDGRKTQTRRVVKPQAEWDNVEPHAKYEREWSPWKDGDRLHSILCPYGVPGDVLWVRETLRRSEVGPWVYRADDEPVEMRRDDPRITEMIGWAHHKEGDVCVSIHMPRWASRISLRMTDVRVERLNEISREDALAEGLFAWTYPDCDGDPRLDGRPCEGAGFHWREPEREHDGFGNPVAAYRDLWERINGADSWAANPWVWAVSFEPLS